MPASRRRAIFTSLWLTLALVLAFSGCSESGAGEMLDASGTWQVSYVGDPAAGVKVLILRQEHGAISGTVTDRVTGSLAITGTVTGSSVHLRSDSTDQHPGMSGAQFDCLTIWDATLSDGSHMMDGIVTASGRACPGYASFGTWTALKYQS